MVSVSESAHKDEEHGARGAGSPGESGLGEEIGAPDEDLALRMDTNTSRGWNSGGRAFLRGIGQRVSFDPEAPPPPSQPARKIDEKVKVSRCDINIRSREIIERNIIPCSRIKTKLSILRPDRKRETRKIVSSWLVAE